MPEAFEIRADYDAKSIVVYQAFSPAIALSAVEAQRFVPPFSLERMTWIKPSFLWLMERSNWGEKPNQECILAVRITRTGWEEALSSSALTSPSERVYPSHEAWREQFERAPVRIQWDPERSLRGASLPYRSIQVGIGRHVVRKYVEEWTVAIEDYTARAKKIATLVRSGNETEAKDLLPPEQVYPLPPEIRQRIGVS